MKITISANKAFFDYVGGFPDQAHFATDVYLGGFLESKGHEVTFVRPGHVNQSNNMTSFAKEFAIKGMTSKHFPDSSNLELKLVGQNTPLDADVVLLRGLGEDESYDFQVNRTFFNALFPLEKQVPLLLNSARTTNLEIKKEQKKLDLPFIPYWRVSSKSDLKELLKDERSLMLKPDIGFKGTGVTYLSASTSLDSCTEEILNNSSFERVIENNTETRYIVMNGAVQFAVEQKRKGSIGQERLGLYTFKTQSSKKQLDIVNSAVEQTGLFYGSVDFRGEDYVLEINGSGTGLFVPGQPYDLVPTLAKAIEEKYTSL